MFILPGMGRLALTRQPPGVRTMSDQTNQAPAYEPPPNGFRTFLVVWITQSVSVFGSALTYFAINIWLTQTLYPRPDQKPQLALALSALGLAMALPMLVAGPIAGAWADRHDRKRTMLTMD